MWRPVIARRTKKAELKAQRINPVHRESDSSRQNGNERDFRVVAMPKRFFSLDALRGVAALAVVFWHWQHFFYQGTTSPGVIRSNQPFYEIFFVFYERGWMAVDLFFCLSGFIFFWLYAERITNRRIRFADFSVLRLSRLYPLHLATLLSVALAQWQMRARTGDYFVYSLNDAYHFFLNLLFISGWRTSFGDSFNAPVWSVSVEVFLYGLFFALCLLGRPSLLRLLMLAAIGGALKFYVPIGRGIFGFFLGGIAYYVYEALFRRRLVTEWIKWVSIVVVIGWALIALELRFGILGSLQSGGSNSIYLGRVSNLLVTGVLMPVTILFLALAETERGELGKSLSFLGDISYSSYLLHFPLQLLVVTIAGSLGIGSEYFYSRASLLGFFVVLIGLSLFSYHYFERPLQEWIRTSWRGSGKTWATRVRESPQTDAAPPRQ